MWLRFRQTLTRLWRLSERLSGERRTAKARARFWADVREGQREAETESRP